MTNLLYLVFETIARLEFLTLAHVTMFLDASQCLVIKMDWEHKSYQVCFTKNQLRSIVNEEIFIREIVAGAYKELNGENK